MAKRWVVSNAAVMMGKPVIAGTRITMELILDTIAAGESVEQILAAHARLTRRDVLAAIGFAAEALRADVTFRLVTVPREDRRGSAAGHAHRGS